MSCPDVERWSELGDPTRDDELERHLDVCRACCELVAVLARAEEPDDDAHIGRYVVRGPIGAGGMGVVLEAHDPLLDRVVALKLVRASASEARLLDEARAMAKLAHPNVVTIHEVVVERDEVFIAMERVDGPDLATWLATAARSPRERLRALLDAGRGIAAAHAAGLVHRDIKPANILIGSDGRARIADFGLAGAGGLAGTPGYIAPEGNLDARADQFAFAVTAQQVLEPSGRIASVLARARAQTPGDRFPTFDRMLAALERAARPRWPRIAVAALAVVAVALGVGLWRESSRTDDCADPTLGGAWTPPRRALFLAAHARSPGLAERTVQLIDARAMQWSHAIADTCSARVRDTALADARSACLESQRHELAGMIDGLGAAPADAALRAIAHQPLADACDAPAPPAAAERDPRHRAVLDELVAIRALRASARYADATRRLDAVVVPDGDLSLAAEVAQMRGDLATRSGNAAGALPLLHDAIAAAERARDDGARLRAMIVLLQALDELGRTSETAELVPLAEGLAASFAARLADRVSLDAALGGEAYNAGSYDVAERHFRAALANLAREYGDVEAPEIAGTLDNLAMVLHAEGKDGEAREQARRSLAMFEHTVGPTHPDTALPLTDLGAMALQDGDLDEAARLLERVVAIRTAALGADHPELSETLGMLGQVELRRGHVDRALELHRRALAIATKGFGEHHPLVAEEQLRIADILSRAGEIEEPRRLCEASVRTWDMTGTMLPDAFDARFLLAQLVWKDDHARGVALAEAARSGYAGMPAPYRDGAAEISTWLASHR